MARIHENWLKAYMEFTAFSESPDAFHFWTGVSTIAGALRRKVWIDQYHFQWTPNFYIILVGPPGVVAKSTSIHIGLQLLREIENVSFGPDSMTWQGLTKALAEALVIEPFGDTGLPMSCITCAVSELGTFLRPSDRELVSVLIDLWDGRLGVWKRRLKAEETVIENPWINVISGTVPAWLQDNMPEVMIGGGLISRIVFVYGDKKRHLVAYPGDMIDRKRADILKEALIEDLNSIATMVGQYELDDEAKVWGKQWYEELNLRRPEQMASDRYSGYLARKQAHVHKLAIVLAASQRDELLITVEDLKTAVRFVTSLEADMEKIFQSIGVSEVSRHAAEIRSYIQALGHVGQVKLWRHCISTMSPKDFGEAIDALARAGYIKIIQEKGSLIYIAIKEEEDGGSAAGAD